MPSIGSWLRIVGFAMLYVLSPVAASAGDAVIKIETGQFCGAWTFYGLPPEAFVGCKAVDGLPNRYSGSCSVRLPRSKTTQLAIGGQSTFNVKVDENGKPEITGSGFKVVADEIRFQTTEIDVDDGGIDPTWGFELDPKSCDQTHKVLVNGTTSLLTVTGGGTQVVVSDDGESISVTNPVSFGVDRRKLTFNSAEVVVVPSDPHITWWIFQTTREKQGPAETTLLLNSAARIVVGPKSNEFKVLERCNLQPPSVQVGAVNFDLFVPARECGSGLSR